SRYKNMAEVAGSVATPAQPPATEEEYGEGEWEGEYDEDELEDEEDIDAAAAAIAQKLEAELWADIQRVNGSSTPAAGSGSHPPPPMPQAQPVQGRPIQMPTTPPTAQELATVNTVRVVIATLERDSVALATFASSTIPDLGGPSVLDVLRDISGSGRIPHGLAGYITRFVVALAKSESLFGGMKNSEVPSQTLRQKRKREEDEEQEYANKRAHVAAPAHPTPLLGTTTTLESEISAAVRKISQTIKDVSDALSPALVTSIQPQLHRIFLFAVSSSQPPGIYTAPLQEIGGLIQVIGLLGHTEIVPKDSIPSSNNNTFLASVYPCLVDGCGKFYTRSDGLREHQKFVHEGMPPRAVNRAGESEVDGNMVATARTVVLSLHSPLQVLVANALSASAQPANGAVSSPGIAPAVPAPGASSASVSTPIASPAVVPPSTAPATPVPPPIVAAAASPLVAASPPAAIPPPVTAAAFPPPVVSAAALPAPSAQLTSDVTTAIATPDALEKPTSSETITDEDTLALEEALAAAAAQAEAELLEADEDDDEDFDDYEEVLPEMYSAAP
ncbi:unnamed protein product, partial [Mycena citricolor]